MSDFTFQSKHPVRDIVERLEAASERDWLSLGDLLEAFGAASFVPGLMIPAILVVSPLSGIPFFSSVCGITIALVALQMILHREHLWLPEVLMRRSIRGWQLGRAMSRIARVADWIDGHSRDRLLFLCTNPGVKIPQALAMICGASMPMLELLPFSSSILGMAVLFFSVSFLARDGFYVIGGMAFMALASLVPVFIWLMVAQ
ncbi:exopolysaccharide biosynthesis protein [Pelagovum pacificum]|uniref:Exopolysaccharide biosynthesis protein n=1 Tax=Pelagovum pacificum TaxID=2588711 RepID=A0A5C5G9Y5_9RHOB|nr:exopolysaccharide biosynthesis protein [Pelagovum pacificum]QQA42514.1 exopolysaccharide biosynthesis protein [Pelagovum pacificum]TNY31598.1 exopolysaccharide biosynthesis protein [Pelagovum pacificum]